MELCVYLEKKDTSSSEVLHQTPSQKRCHITAEVLKRLSTAHNMADVDGESAFEVAVAETFLAFVWKIGLRSASRMDGR